MTEKMKHISVPRRDSSVSLPILLGYNLLDSDVKIKIILASVVAYFILAIIFYIILKKAFQLPFMKLVHNTFHATRLAFGILYILGGVDTVFWSSSVYSDVVKGNSVASVFITAVTFSYTVVDTIIFLITGWITGNVLNSIAGTVHHLVMLPLYTFSLITDTGYFFCSAFLLVEVGCLGVPSNVTAGTAFGKSFIGRLYSMFAIHVFHIRNFIEGYLWVVVYKNWDRISSEMPVSVTVSLFIMLGAISLLLTPVWAYFLTLKIMLRNFTPPSKSQANSSSEKKKN